MAAIRSNEAFMYYVFFLKHINILYCNYVVHFQENIMLFSTSKYYHFGLQLERCCARPQHTADQHHHRVATRYRSGDPENYQPAVLYKSALPGFLAVPY